MIHLKYKCKVNFVKLPLIWIYLCLKLVFENATAGRYTGCRSVVNCARYQPTPTFPAFHTSVESMTPPAVQKRFTRGRVRELKNGHNSVTVQNRTHVYVNFFHHKGLENHLLQLCPKVVKHPVCIHSISQIFCGREFMFRWVTWIIGYNRVCCSMLSVDVRC